LVVTLVVSVLLVVVLRLEVLLKDCRIERPLEA
jgi:hypothetical protein